MVRPTAELDTALLRAHDLEGVIAYAEGRRHAGLRQDAMAELEPLEQVLVRAGYARGYLAPYMGLTAAGARRLRDLVTDEANIRRVAAGYDAYQRGGESRDHERAGYGWALSQVLDWAAEEDVDFLWRVILELCAHTEDDWVLGMIAAGPVWDFIDRFADPALDLIEAEIRRGNRKLLRVLAGVWLDAAPIRPRIDRVLALHGRDRM